MASTSLIFAPFGFDAVLMLPRRTKPARTPLIEETPLEVATVTGADAPVSLRFGGNEYRGHGARCFRRLRGPLGEPEASEAQLAEWLKAVYRREVSPAGWADYPWGRDKLHLFAISEASKAIEREGLEYREWISDDRLVRLAFMRAVAADLLIVDGVVWTATPEPVLRLSIAASNRSARLSPDAGRVIAPASEREAWFRLDRATFVSECARAMGAHPEVIGQFDVLRPDLLAFDERRGAAERAAELCHRAGVGFWVAQGLDLETLRVELRSALGGFPEGVAFPGGPSIAVIRAMHGALEPHSGQPAKDQLRQRLADILLSERFFVEAGDVVEDLEALDLVF